MEDRLGRVRYSHRCGASHGRGRLGRGDSALSCGREPHPLFAGIAVGLGLIVTAAFQHTEFQRSHPFIQDFYTVEDRQRTQRLFAWLLVAGIALVFTGIVLTALTDSLSEFVQTEAAALMMGLIAVGVWCIVYGSMMLGRLNIANYNDAREQAIAESDEGKVIVNSDAAALRAMYTDEQICALLGAARGVR